MHVPGEQNKVADCLSRYYENDREDLTELRLQELGEDQLKGLLFAQCLRDRNEDRVVEAETMAKAAHLVDIPEDINPQDDIHDMTKLCKTDLPSEK
jgi:hypothetical protein